MPAAAAISELRGLGLRPLLRTVDNYRTARSVADQVGIDEVVAEVLPADKVDVIKKLQREALRTAVECATGGT